MPNKMLATERVMLKYQQQLKGKKVRYGGCKKSKKESWISDPSDTPLFRALMEFAKNNAIKVTIDRELMYPGSNPLAVGWCNGTQVFVKYYSHGTFVHELAHAIDYKLGLSWKFSDRCAVEMIATAVTAKVGAALKFRTNSGCRYAIDNGATPALFEMYREGIDVIADLMIEEISNILRSQN